MKINFRRLTAVTSFDGSTTTFDVSETVGNAMMYNGSVILDIGFEDLAKRIYYATEEVEIPQRYAAAMVEVVKESRMIAAVKRELIHKLTE